jgi:hypothetical protein
MPSHPFASIRRGRRLPPVAATVAILALTFGALTAANPAGAAPQTESIPLADIGGAPVSDTLDNQVGWSVNAGSWQPPQGYAVQTPVEQVWTFDRPGTVRFGLAGLNLAEERFELPVGVVAESIHGDHVFDTDNSTWAPSDR